MSQEITYQQYTPNTNYYTPIPGYTPYLRFYGEGIVRKKDAQINSWPLPYDPGRYTSIELDDGISGAAGGFLETFFRLEKLILSESVQSIEETKELSAMLTNNHVIVRGIFDSFAEKFANAHRLRFVHSNIFLAESSNHYETDVWTLRFEDSGTPYLHCNVHAYMGGEERRELPDGILEGCTLEEFAELFGESVTEQILQNKALQKFLECVNSGKKQRMVQN